MRIVLIVAQSLDGYITRHDTPGVAWASAADQKWFRKAVSQFDAQVMARTTYETVRAMILPVAGSSPTRIVMTRQPQEFAADAQADRLQFTDDSADEIRKKLAAGGHQQCALLGGSAAHDAFLAAGLVDEIWVTIEPRIFGNGTPVVRMAQDQQLEIIDHQRLPDSDSIVVRYSIKR